MPFSRVLYIERDDFREDAAQEVLPSLARREVRLRCAYFIRCERGRQGRRAGEITELRCTYDPATRGGDAPAGAR